MGESYITTKSIPERFILSRFMEMTTGLRWGVDGHLKAEEDSEGACDSLDTEEIVAVGRDIDLVDHGVIKVCSLRLSL